MATIKKAYVEIIDFLKANSQMQVSEVLDEVVKLASAKLGSGGKASTFHRDEDGTVVAALCYYHKRWFDPRVVEFGKKANSASGLSSMTKDGISKWNKQQNAAKKAEAELLDRLISGDITADQIEAEREAIAESAKYIEPLLDDNGVVAGYETLEECLAAQ